MPVSKVRKKKYPVQNQLAGAKTVSESPKWLAPLMLSLMVLGLVWIVTFYLTSSWPVPALGRWNLGVGFGLILTGFGLTTRWR